MSSSVLCFSTTQDKCVESTVVDIPELGIKQGSSIAETLESAIEGILANKKAIEDCSFCGGQGYTNTEVEPVEIVTGSSNTCTATINNVIELTVNPSSSSIGIFYSLEQLVNSLGSGYSVINAQVTIKSNSNTIIYSGSEISAGFNVNPSKFPIVLNSLIRLSTPCGVIEYSRSFPLESTSSSSGTFNLNADSVAKETLTSQNTVNNYFNSRLDQLESSMNRKPKTTILGCNGSSASKGSTEELLQQAYNLICQLQVENESLQSQISALESSTTESMNTLQSSIVSLQNQINTLK